MASRYILRAIWISPRISGVRLFAGSAGTVLSGGRNPLRGLHRWILKSESRYEDKNGNHRGGLLPCYLLYHCLPAYGCESTFVLAVRRTRLYLRLIRPLPYVLFSIRLKSRCGNPLGNSGIPSPSRTGTTPR